MDVLILIALILLGFGLLAVEVYLIPGLNVAGILGVLVLIFAVGFAFSSNGVLGGIFALGGTVLLGALIAYATWRSGAWEEFVLATTMVAHDGYGDKAQDRSRFIGKTGSALTPLRPSGVAEIDDQRVEVQTEGGFIAAGSSIRVVAIDSRHIFVRLDTPVTEPQDQSEG